MNIDDFFQGRKDEWDGMVEKAGSVDYLLGWYKNIEDAEDIPDEVKNYCHIKIYQRIYQLI